MLNIKQAVTGFGWMVAMVILGGITIMFTFFNFGISLAVLSGIVVVLSSILFFVAVLMYITGSFERVRVSVPVKKSVIKSKLTSIKNRPFKIQKGRKSDFVVRWKLGKKEYIMKIWLKGETHTCKFKEEIKEGKKVRRLDARHKACKVLKKEGKDQFMPTIWPNLVGEKEICPQDVKKLLLEICDESGWRIIRL